MSKLDLSGHSDKEIVAAFFNLPAMKFIPVMNAMGAIADRMAKRGQTIAKDNSDDIVENVIRQLFGDDK